MPVACPGPSIQDGQNDPLNIQNGQRVKIIEFYELMKVTIQYNHTREGHPVPEKTTRVRFLRSLVRY